MDDGLGLRIECAEDEVSAVAIEGEAVGKALVERALPPTGEGRGGPVQTVAMQTGATEIKDADLLAGEGGERAAALGGHEIAVIGDEHGTDRKLAHISHHQRQIAQRVVFALAGGAKIYDGLGAALDAIFR